MLGGGQWENPGSSSTRLTNQRAAQRASPTSPTSAAPTLSGPRRRCSSRARRGPRIQEMQTSSAGPPLAAVLELHVHEVQEAPLLVVGEALDVDVGLFLVAICGHAKFLMQHPDNAVQL